MICQNYDLKKNNGNDERHEEIRKSTKRNTYQQNGIFKRSKKTSNIHHSADQNCRLNEVKKY